MTQPEDQIDSAGRWENNMTEQGVEDGLYEPDFGDNKLYSLS